MLVRVDSKLSPVRSKTRSNMASLKLFRALSEIMEVGERKGMRGRHLKVEKSAMARAESQKKRVVLVVMG